MGTAGSGAPGKGGGAVLGFGRGRQRRPSVGIAKVANSSATVAPGASITFGGGGPGGSNASLGQAASGTPGVGEAIGSF
jgi:hypothetical protein